MKTSGIGRGNHPHSRSALTRYQFKQGESGNPSGRPKDDKAREIARAIFEQNPEAIYEAMGKLLLKGNVQAFKELAERAYGKVAQAVELSGAEGGPIEYSYLSDSELNARIKQLQAEVNVRPEK